MLRRVLRLEARGAWSRPLQMSPAAAMLLVRFLDEAIALGALFVAQGVHGEALHALSSNACGRSSLGLTAIS